METLAVGGDEVEAAVACLVDAFVDDPQMAFYFPDEPWQRFRFVQQFFPILMDGAAGTWHARPLRAG